MPELPEVTTTVLGLKREVINYTITDCWSDLPSKHPTRSDFFDTIKYEPFFKSFLKKIKGQKIIGARRRAKNILIDLANGYTILIHLKMTGHLMVGLYKKVESYKVHKVKGGKQIKHKETKWVVHRDEKNNSLRDSYNKYIHCVFTLTNNKKGITKMDEVQGGVSKIRGGVLSYDDEYFGRSNAEMRHFSKSSLINKQHLVFCDARKFGKITIEKTSEIEHGKHLKDAGPEPIDSKTNPKIKNDMSFVEFEKVLNEAKGNSRQIKTFLMDTRTISGIGNIYSDELLFRAAVHPKSNWNKIPKNIRKKIYESMILVLRKGINFGGDSTSDYRNIYGQKGHFHENHLAYQNKGKACSIKNCKGTITREMIDGRSAHSCPVHQKLYR